VRSLKFAYRLFDGTVFWPWGEVQTTPLPRETTLLGASDPPHYQQGSHIIGDYTLDEALFVWRRR
jgi:hypothetical protein